MKTILYLLAILLPAFTSAQPAIEWQRCYGGSGDEYPGRIRTVDGGYIIVSTSASADGMVNNSHGNFDAWVVKMDQYGIIEWKKCYGGSGYDYGRSIFEDPSGGYIVCGGTSSNDGNVSGGHSDSNGSIADIWIFKIDLTGNLIWQRCLGGSSIEDFAKFSLCTDGGLLVTCQNYSDDGDVEGFHASSNEVSSSWGNPDIWVVKLSNLGSIIWQQCLGGSGRDHGEVIEDINGGYLVFGSTTSNDGDVVGFHDNLDLPSNFLYSNSDIWVIKLNDAGNIMWQACLGGSSDDDCSYMQPVIPSNDGGYLVVGNTTSSDGDVVGYHLGLDSLYQEGYWNGSTYVEGIWYYWRSSDTWIVKLDASGNIAWQRCLGGTADEYLNHISSGQDGYLLAGSTSSDDGDVVGYHAGAISYATDIWIVQLDESGDILWQRCLGGSQHDWFADGKLMDDGYLFNCQTSSVNGDVTGYHPGMTSSGERTNDAWIFKTDFAGNMIWQKCLGGTGDDYIERVEPTESGYFFVGFTNSIDGDVVGFHEPPDSVEVNLFSFGDIWVGNIDLNGELINQLCLGGSNDDDFIDFLYTGDGYLIQGVTKSNDGDVTGHYGSSDIWLVQLSNVVGVEETTQANMALFPNPASDRITVITDQDFSNDSYIVYDAQGRALLQGVLTSRKNEIAVESLSQGIYTLRTVGAGVGAVKFMKE
jgi:hypothetical protein